MAETLVPQFTVEVGAADGITDTAGVEPDATKKGAFFFVGIASLVCCFLLEFVKLIRDLRTKTDRS